MGSDKAQDAAARAQDDEKRRAGNSGEGIASVLALLRKRRIAQFRETATDPDTLRGSDSELDGTPD
jgi:hypothetical protein